MGIFYFEGHLLPTMSAQLKTADSNDPMAQIRLLVWNMFVTKCTLLYIWQYDDLCQYKFLSVYPTWWHWNLGVSCAFKAGFVTVDCLICHVLTWWLTSDFVSLQCERLWCLVFCQRSLQLHTNGKHGVMLSAVLSELTDPHCDTILRTSAFSQVLYKSFF